MKKVTKAIAAIMLMTAAVFAAGCTKEEPSSGSHNGHAYVDLGLPSGTLWATSNLEAGNSKGHAHFAWGETMPMSYTSVGQEVIANYKFWGTDGKMSKYCSTDHLTVLDDDDDAATVHWGEGWHMPDGTEVMELLNECGHRWDSINGVSGLLVIGENGNTLFLPAAGLKGVFSWEEDFQTEFNQAGHSGQYWMRERGVAFNNYSTPDVEYLANEFYFPYGNNGGSRTERSRGLPIRPVCSAK